ncbi:MAG: hypothetical protein ACRDQI_06210 [Pseudonocardiaceae bacterium]
MNGDPAVTELSGPDAHELLERGLAGGVDGFTGAGPGGAGVHRSPLVSRGLGPRPRGLAHWIPDGDIIAYVTNGVASVLGPCRTVARVHAGATTIAELVPPVARVEHLDESTCLLHIGAATPLLLAVYLAALGVEFTVDGPPELLEQLITVSTRCRPSARSRNRSCKPASASPAKIEA